MNYYPFHIGDFLSATKHLSWIEDAAFRRLLDVYYTTEKPLPNDLRAVCRLVLASTDEQREAVQIVLNEFFELMPTGWVNHRADVEILQMQDKRQKARESALVGVEMRNKKLEQSNAQLRATRMAEARSKATHTAEQWTKMVSLCGGACVRCGTTGAIVKDHILPIYQGGSDGIENLQPLCSSCTSSKGIEAFDHRPPGVRSAFADDISANAIANAEKESAMAQLPIPIPIPNKKNTSAVAPPDGVPAIVWQDFTALRKEKKAKLTQTAMDGIKSEAAKAGWTLESALRECCTRGWSGFKADWVAAQERRGNAPPAESFRERDARAGRARWEEMTGEAHPDNRDAPAIGSILNVVDVTPRLVQA